MKDIYKLLLKNKKNIIYLVVFIVLIVSLLLLRYLIRYLKTEKMKNNKGNKNINDTYFTNGRNLGFMNLLVIYNDLLKKELKKHKINFTPIEIKPDLIMYNDGQKFIDKYYSPDDIKKIKDFVYGVMRSFRTSHGQLFKKNPNANSELIFNTSKNKINELIKKDKELIEEMFKKTFTIEKDDDYKKISKKNIDTIELDGDYKKSQKKNIDTIKKLKNELDEKNMLLRNKKKCIIF